MNNRVFYYLKNGDPNHRLGVRVIVSKNTNALVLSAIPYSERIMMLQLKTLIGNLHIIFAYSL